MALNRVGALSRRIFVTPTSLRIWEPVPTSKRTAVLIFDRERDAKKYAKELNEAQERGEELYAKGEADTSKPDDDETFTTEGRISNDFVVKHKSGKIVGVYETEEEANAVANEMNKTTEKAKKRAGCIDPWIPEEL